MGIKIGCPSLKLAVSRSSKSRASRTGKMQAVACEALETRMGKDKDIDRSKTPENEYIGIRNPYEFTSVLRKEAEAYSEARRAAGGRGLRSDAATGFAIVLKPPADFVNGLPQSERDRFMGDLLESFRESTSDLLADDAIKSIVKHKDEKGDHWHVLGLAKTPTGEISADKVVCPKLWKALNQNIPDVMRQKGWDVTECVNYDPDHAATLDADEKQEYKAKCRARRKQSGRTSGEYKAEREMEKLRAENEALKRKMQEAETRKPLEQPQEAPEAPERPQQVKSQAGTRKAPERPQKPPERQPRHMSMIDRARQTVAQDTTTVMQTQAHDKMQELLKRLDAPTPPPMQTQAKTRKPSEQPQEAPEAPERPQQVKSQPTTQEVPRTPQKPPEKPAEVAPRPLPSNRPQEATRIAEQDGPEY